MEFSGDAEIQIQDNAVETIIIRAEKDATIRLEIGKNCRVSTYIIQEGKAKIMQNSGVGENSVLHSHCLWLNEGEGKVQTVLQGKKSEAHDLHIFVEKEKLHLDTLLRHVGEDTKGDILVKGVVMGNGSAKLDGMIKIDKTGAGADSILKEHVMLLNPGAHAIANPDLEIENNNVTSTHAASVSQIDEEKLFYLASRGISRDDAKKLIVHGFLESGVETIKNDEMKREFMERLEDLY